MSYPAVPANQHIAHQVYCGIALDGLNNEVPAWEDPTDVAVIGWRVTKTRALGDYTSRQTTEGLLLVPPDLIVNIHDRFTLPQRGDGMGGLFEVVELRDVSHGFHQWNPGSIAVIRKTPETERAEQAAETEEATP